MSEHIRRAHSVGCGFPCFSWHWHPVTLYGSRWALVLDTCLCYKDEGPGTWASEGGGSARMARPTGGVLTEVPICRRGCAAVPHVRSVWGEVTVHSVDHGQRSRVGVAGEGGDTAIPLPGYRRRAGKGERTVWTVGDKKLGEPPSRLYLGEEVAGLNQQREVEDLP